MKIENDTDRKMPAPKLEETEINKQKWCTWWCHKKIEVGECDDDDTNIDCQNVVIVDDDAFKATFDTQLLNAMKSEKRDSSCINGATINVTIKIILRKVIAILLLLY